MKRLFLLSVLVLSAWTTNQAAAQVVTTVGTMESSLVYNNVVPDYTYIDKVNVSIRAWDANTILFFRARYFQIRVYRVEDAPCPSTSGAVLIGSLSFNEIVRINQTFTVDVLDQLAACPNSNDPCPVVPYNIFVELVPLTQPGQPRHVISGIQNNCIPVVLPTATEGITSPTEGANIFTGGTFDLRWNPSFFGNTSTVQIQVFSNGTLRFSGNVPNNGRYNSYQGPDGAMQVIVTGGGQTDTVNFDFTRD
ncbi:hypothetical protein BKI52_15520 [marine bacterium AO1-C]|nr:hypothetical protein BKI52_15520 [marine bacterium AO1-C]